MAVTLPEVKPRQLQISRLLREEEDDWISGEELQTEGSSDEESHQPPTSATTSEVSLDRSPKPERSSILDDYHALINRRTSAPADLLKWKPSLRESSEPIIKDEPHLTETTRRLSEMGFQLPPPLHIIDAARKERARDEVEEQEEVMLWRPKRGSKRLPRVDLDSAAALPLSTPQVTG